MGCSDSSGPGMLGSVSFTYTGAGGGTFTASGNAPTVLPSPTATSWARGFVAGGAYTEVGGSRPRAGGLVDIVSLRMDLTAAGSVTIGQDCPISGSTECNALLLGLNLNRASDDPGDLDFLCVLTAGTITITEMSDSRAKGTFSGTGECAAPGTPGTAFGVTNGTFDVAMVPEPA